MPSQNSELVSIKNEEEFRSTLLKDSINYPGGNEQFKIDALFHSNLLDHPKKDKIFDFVYKHGHSSGYYEIWYWLDELADLFEV